MTTGAIKDFISLIHPYDALPQDERTRIAASFERRPATAGSMIYQVGDRLPGLYLIESGRIRVADANGDSVSELSARDSLGERGLLGDGTAVTTATAIEDSSVLMLPRDNLLRLIDTYPVVARFFVHGRMSPGRSNDLAMLRVGELVHHAPLSCSPDTPAITAAQMMRDAGASSIGIVQDGRLTGLMTIRDISGRIVAEGRDAHTPVGQVMTPDPITLSPDQLGYDVLHIMLERRIGHLPVVSGGRFVGMVSQTDLTRVLAMSSAALIHDIAGARTVQALAGATARIPELLLQLMRAHHHHQGVTRMITDIGDAVTRRLIALAQEQLGPAPGPFLWAACGSQGRQEQTGLSDQDNCLLLGDECPADHPWFAGLARFVSDGLNACGYVYCPGDMMATNPRWCQPVSVWRGYFRDWIANPGPEARLLASVMFDLRAIGGDATLLQGLQAETLAMASRNSIFVAHMAANALTHRPPLGLVGGLATIRSGKHRRKIDMKLNGVAPVIELARVCALQGGLAAVNTRERLIVATDRGVLSERGGRELIAAYDLIQTTRLDNQAEQIQRGLPPDNLLDPAGLPAFERSHLRDAFVVVRTMQSGVGYDKRIPG